MMDLSKNKNIRKLKKWLSRTPKNCILCESWVLFKAPLCKDCRRYLYSEYLKHEFHILNIEDRPCYYLWEWNQRNHEWIQKIIVAMKDGHNFELYKLFMPWLLKKTSFQTQWITAIPSFDRNHPLALTKVYQLFNPEAESISLVKQMQKSQKGKSKHERQNIGFAFKDSGFDLKSVKTNLWVLDDVIATGGSFKAVLKLFKGDKVSGALVWAYKSKSVSH